MADNSTIKKVLWRNGDVISEDHFYALEEWTQNLVGLTNQQVGTFGLFRNINLQPDYNDINSISFRHVDGINYKVGIENIQAVNMYGHLIRIDGSRELDFQFRPSQRNIEGKYFLYLLPKLSSQDDILKSVSDVVTGMVLYDMQYEVSLTNDNNAGVIICRFHIDNTEITIDKSFVPFGIFIDSSPISLAARDCFLKKFTLWNSLLETYLKSLRPTPELTMIWNMAGLFLRTNAAFKPLFEFSHTPTINYFTTIQQFINIIKTDLRILSVGWEQESLKLKAAEVVEKLETPILTNDKQFEVGLTFGLVESFFDYITKFLSYLPSGPIAEKTLPISKVELMKEAAGNRLNIYLEGEAQFVRGKTQMTVSLREFSKTDPISKNIRIGMGSAIFAQLLDLKNILKRIPGESFSYMIECPPEVVSKERTSQLTLYLPPPLGEGIIDLKSHITLIIRD
ncbi:MAG: hypothetical protein QME52_07020 [Bacteroidota bacterium]|nr:hypothetical protein [Bacteroidota bacterium]